MLDARNCDLRITILDLKYLMAKLKLDLHEICKKGHLIEKELKRVIDEASEKRISTRGNHSRKRERTVKENRLTISRPT